jgi:hypothetical protein
MDQPLIEAHVVLRPAEFARGSFEMSLRAFRWVIVIWIGLACLMLLVAFGPEAEPSSLRSALAVLGVLVAFLVASWFGALYQFHRLPTHLKTVTWRFYADHIETAGELGSATFQRRALWRVRESKGLFLFQPQRNLCYILPKRVLGAAGVSELRRLAVETLGRSATVQTPRPRE